MALELPNYTIEVNAFEAGVLMGMIEKEGGRVRSPLSNVWRQLVELKKKYEKDAGVVKRLLPNGSLEITDVYGNRIIRPPYSWEIGNS